MNPLSVRVNKKVSVRAKVTRASGHVDEFNPHNPIAVFWVNLKHKVRTLLHNN